MILLALRILLVLLTGLLLARFLGFTFAGFQVRNNVHVVILDDRLSTEDYWKPEDGGDIKNAYQLGKERIEDEVAKVLAQARTPQRLVLFRLSEPGTRFDRLLNEETRKELHTELAKMEGPTARHLDLNKGLEAAAEIFGNNPEHEKFLYLVSDFRQLHWNEPEATALLKNLQGLAASGVKIQILDSAHPKRSEQQRNPLYHDNLAIVELRPETRVAAEGMPVQFLVTVANFSPSEKKNVRVTIKVEGEERPEGSLTMLSVPPGRTSQTFQVGFVRGQDKEPKAKAEEKGFGFQVITAQLENEEAGLVSDNLRYAVIEVRRQVPVLIVDGDPGTSEKPGGDTFHLRTLFNAARGFDVIRGTVSDLERPNLDQYPSIYLVNAPRFTEKALANLKAYVEGGGGIAFFMGDRVDSAYYNKELYADGKGIFPAPLAAQPSRALSDEDKLQKLAQNLEEQRMQVYVRSDAHPIVSELYKFRTFLTFLTIDRYWPVQRQRWKTEEGRVEELLTLPNDRAVADYQAFAQEILDLLPVEDPEWERFHAALKRHQALIRATLTGKSLHQLANALDALLRDPAEGSEAKTGRLTEFWEQPDAKVQELRSRVERFKQAVQYGDPLLIAQHYKRGRVTAFLSTAGKKWNDWAGGSPASSTYPMLMIDLQKYLTGQDVEANKIVGEPLEVERPNFRYEARARCFVHEARDIGLSKSSSDKEGGAVKPLTKKDLGEFLGLGSGERLLFSFDKTTRPGVYQFDLTQRADMGGEAKTESVAFAFNVDTNRESDLRRVSSDELDKYGKIHIAGEESLSSLVDPHRDLSESPWLYLIFLVILVIEQALAVHLSFHLRSGEALPPPQALRPQATAA
jgi:hypothetical protein